MFSALLIEGKEPPHIREIGESVLVGFPKRDLNSAFRLFVAEESRHERNLGVDELLLLQYLLQHPEVDTGTASTLANGVNPKSAKGSRVWSLQVTSNTAARGGEPTGVSTRTCTTAWLKAAKVKHADALIGRPPKLEC